MTSFSQSSPRTPLDARSEALSYRRAHLARRIRYLESSPASSARGRIVHPEVAAILDDARAELRALETAATGGHVAGLHPHPIRSQHQWLTRTAERLGSLLQRIAAHGEVVEPDRDAALLVMSCFSRELEAHFRLEEDGGHLAAALSIAPRFGRRAVALKKQHGQLSERIGSLVAEANQAGDSGDLWRRACEGFQGFRSELRHHETAENEIMQRAHNEDIGSAD